MGGFGSNLGRAFRPHGPGEDEAGDSKDSAGRPARPVGTADYIRFALLAGASFGLALPALHWLKAWPAIGSTPFFYFGCAVVAVKLIADLIYHLISPRHREWSQLDDYLGNDFFTFFRFGFPLAVAQAYLLQKGMVPVQYTALWLGPALPLTLVLINRWLIERAQEKSRARRGGALDIRARE